MTSSRRQARIVIFQAAYSLVNLQEDNFSKALASTRPLGRVDEKSKADDAIISQMKAGMEEERAKAYDQVIALLDTPIEQVGKSELVIMLLAAVELLARPETPKAVVINEWLEIAKQFCAETSHKLINVIIDQLPHEKS